MPDKNAQKILSYINSECKDGVFKVITNEDLVSVFDKKHRPTENEISKSIEELKRKKLITVKYKDDSFYLITGTENSKIFSFKEEPAVIKFELKHILLFISTSLAAGLAGGLISGLILKLFG